MSDYIHDTLNQYQCEQVSSLHNICTEQAYIYAPSVLCLVLPRPDFYEEDTFYGLYYIEETLISFLSVFCPDGKTAEISGFTHPLYQNHGYFSVLLTEAKKEILKRFGNAALLYQGFSNHPGTDAFCHSHNLKLSYSECIMEKKISSEPSSRTFPEGHTALFKADKSMKEKMIALHQASFHSDFSFAESYIDTILKDTKTASYLISSNTDKNIGLFHLTMEKGGQAAYFMGLGILPAFRRKGYAKAAMEFVFKILPENCSLCLQVSTSNRAAFCLYQSLGFQITSALDYFSSVSKAD